MQKYKRTNTFTQTPSVAQIVSYLIYTIQIVFFYVLIQSNYQQQTIKIIIIVVNTVSLIIQFVTSLITSLSDPSDQLMIKLKNEPDKVSNYQVRDVLYCDLCQSFVKISSRHCRICKRCVQEFDHHCIWVNNCIGGKNYRIFFGMICSTFASMAIYIISVALLWSQNKYQGFIVEMGFIWASSVIIGIFMILIFNLILFHIYLKYLGIGTFQFLQAQRKKENQRKAQNPRQNTLESIANEKVEENIKTKQMKEIDIEKQEDIQKIQDNNMTVKKGDKSRSIDIMQRSRVVNKTEQKKIKVYPKNELQNINRNIFDQCSQVVKNQQSEKEESLVISQHFSRSKSLKFFVSDDVDQPQVSYKNKLNIKFPQGSDVESLPKNFLTPKHNL